MTTATRRLMKNPEAEARRIAAVRRHADSKRTYKDQDVYDAWTAGESQRSIARRLGIKQPSVHRAIQRAKRDAARSPIPCPAPADPPPPGRVDGGDASTGGLRGAPATTNGHPGAGSPGVGTGDNERPAKAAGAPIVRRQLDHEGDTVYIVELPATTRYQTHARSMVDALLGPFDPGRVVWINEED